MKKLFYVVAIFACLVIGSQTVKAQALVFDVENSTGFTLNNLYISPAEADEWSADLLPESMFENATVVTISIPESYGETCSFDIQVTDTEGTSVTYYGLDLCQLESMSIFSDGTAQTK